MEAIVRKLLDEIRAMNDRYRENLAIDTASRHEGLALAHITDRRLAIPLNGGYWITRDGRDWLQRN